MAFVTKKSGTGERYYAYLSSGDTRFSVPLGDNERVARRSYADLESQWRRGEYQPVTERTFSRVVEDWRKHAAAGLRTNTITAYEGHLRRVWSPLFAKRRISTIRSVEVQKVVADMVTAGRSPRGIHATVSALSAVLDVAVRQGNCHKNVARQLSLPKVKGSSTTYLDAAGLARLIEGAKGLSAMDKAIVTLAATSALRRSEVVGLCCDCVHDLLTPDARIEVRRSAHGRVLSNELKCSASFGTVPLAPVAADALASWLLERPSVDSDLVFTTDGRPLRDARVNAALKRAVRAAGLPESISIRGLRHSVASVLMSQGASVATVQSVLRHRPGSQVTLGTYVHASPEDARSAVNIMNMMLGATSSSSIE